MIRIWFLTLTLILILFVPTVFAAGTAEQERNSRNEICDLGESEVF